MVKREIIDLINKYQAGSASMEERGKLESWYLKHSIQSPDMTFPDDIWSRKEASLKNIFANSVNKPLRFGVYKTYSWAAAAAILVMLSTAIAFFSIKHPFVSSDDNIKYQNDIKQGKNTAILTLSNGKVINLSDTKTGVVIDADNLSYNDGTKITSAKQISEVVIASTARGSTYQLTLPDGSKVWLNSASSLKFPSTFAKLDKRSVELIGEAYFEVKKDKHHPFLVESKGQQIEVLGTHFNVNSYADQSTVKTTLLEGLIKVSVQAYKTKIVLKPGQQSTFSSKGKLEISTVDTDIAVAWLNNEFMFESESIEDIMKMISRWYDVEIVYIGEKPKENFVGSISRSNNISKVLELLASPSGVHFRIEGKKIYVSK